MTVLKEFGFGSLDVSVNDFIDENIVIRLGVAPDIVMPINK